ncbi:MAG TPA: polysaccharide pyruvyl transferase family protein [Candidatus Dormibacteraeota bacterium]|nr:polysaccharide pyruvyl transferase family protein [Candidatus Dormibacteraeota bacterium]
MSSMVAAESSKRIAVFSHGGVKNLGDEALVAAVIQNVRARIPAVDLIGFTFNPDDTRERHGIPAFPIRRVQKSLVASSISATTHVFGRGGSRVGAFKETLKRIRGVAALARTVRAFLRKSANILSEPKFLLDSYRRLKGVELLLVAGSQQLNDAYGGTWGFPFTLYKWSLLARITRTKVAILSVGAGPIKSSLSKFFFKQVLKSVSYRSYRDDISGRLVASMGVKGDHPVFPDLVYSLRLPDPTPGAKPAGQVVVGTNPIPFFDGRYWYEANSALYKKYVAKMAHFAKWLDSSGHAILFFPTQARADVLTILDIRRAMNGSGHSEGLLPSCPIHDLKSLVSEISRADLVVANRYHGILISLALGKPVIGMAYHEKSRALMEQVGQGQYVVNCAEFEVEDLIASFRSLEANAPAIRKQIAEHMAPLRRALDQQYENVFALIGVAPAGLASTDGSRCDS